MLTKKERMEKLNQAGVSTGKYFNIDLPDGIKPGSTISLIINENGVPEVVSKNDPILNQIIKDGYVRNTKLHRRFVMAQMFSMLNYESWNGDESGFNDCLKNRYGYGYTFKMMLDEVKVLNKLEQRDKDSFIERSHFFTKHVIVSTMEDYMEKLKKYIESLPDKKCKGVPYKQIKGVNIFNADISKKVYKPLFAEINYVKFARNYAEIYNSLQNFMRQMIKLPYNTPKSKAWIDAYKGEGAYYTCKNLIMYHNCYVYSDTGAMNDTTSSMNILNRKLNEYQYEGWRMFAFMKKLIGDNNFDFKKKMSEIYDN